MIFRQSDEIQVKGSLNLEVQGVSVGRSDFEIFFFFVVASVPFVSYLNLRSE